MMDLQEKTVEHPAQNETLIATMLILAYATYGLVPQVIPPASLDVPVPVERVPVQQGTDLSYLTTIASRFGFVFYVDPGPAPMVNTAYWGPPVRAGVPQRALSVDLGADTNVTQITFRSDGLAPTQVTGQVQDRLTNQTTTVRSGGDLAAAAGRAARLGDQPAERPHKDLPRQRGQRTGRAGPSPGRRGGINRLPDGHRNDGRAAVRRRAALASAGWAARRWLPARRSLLRQTGHPQPEHRQLHPVVHADPRGCRLDGTGGGGVMTLSYSTPAQRT